MSARKPMSLSFSGPREAIEELLDTTARRGGCTDKSKRNAGVALAEACRRAAWLGDSARIELDHEEAGLMAMLLERAAQDRGLTCRVARCGPDKSRVLVTVRDRTTGVGRQMELGVLSEFNQSGEHYKRRFIQDWIRDRAQAQTGRQLEFVRYEYLTDRQWFAFYEQSNANEFQPKGGANTKLVLLYRDGVDEERALVVILEGAIDEGQLALLKAKLEEGEYLIADQVGLPTPAEQMRGQDEWPNGQIDNVFTRITNVLDEQAAEALWTNEPPSIALHIDELVARMNVVKEWDIEAEWERQRRVGLSPTVGPSP